MAFKFAVFAAIVAVANAVAIGYPAPLGAYHAPLGAYPPWPGSCSVGAYHAPLGAYHAPLGAYPAVAKVAAPLAYPAIAKVAAPYADYDANPQYSYSYAVADTTQHTKMALRFAVLAAFVATASAVAIGYPAYPAVAKVAAPLADYDPNPQYSYSYAVS
uniref:Uncharacterized protein n=1 Tax=Anopheles stephensi TaxID=30069 RepID=A0A182Y4K0_ANOST